MLIQPRFRPSLIHLVFITVATLAFYGPTIDNYWFKDDLGIGIFTNWTHELDWSAVWSFLWPSHMEREQFWRPIPMVMGFCDYALWGTNPIGYHLGNTLLHALVGILVYFLVNRLTNFANPVIGFVAGLAVVVNPINGEAVVWVLQRMVVVCAAFSLTAMLAWLRAVESGRTRWRVLGYAALVGAMLSKEIGVVLPGVLFLMDLLYAPPLVPWRERWRRAWRGAVPAALLIAAYLGCRYAMWGRVDLKYAGMEPMEYARELRVFERMGDSLTHSFVPVNAGIFEGLSRELLVGTILAAYGLAALRGALLLFRSPAFRKLTVLSAAFLILSFGPTMLIFWIDERLFNARFFYQPGIATMAVVAGALWLPLRQNGADPQRRPLASALIPYTGTALLLLGFSISLAGGLTAFEGGSDQVRGIQQAILEYARQEGDDVAVVAFDTPSQVHGVPTLETSLALALKPPLAPHEVPCLPLLDVEASTVGRWHARLATFVASESVDVRSLRYVRCTYHPPGIQPLFGQPERAQGAYPTELLSPLDNAFFKNDDAEPEPIFSFRVTGAPTRFVLCLNSRDKPDTTRINVQAGVNGSQDGDVVTYVLSRGDAKIPGFPNIWKAAIQVPHPHPIPVVWRVESYDGSGELIGVSRESRVLILNAR